MGKDNEKIKASKREYQKAYRKSRKEIKAVYTPDEFKVIAENAEKAGLPEATYVRDVSLKKRINVPPAGNKLTLESKAEIRRIGINLNQIAKALNGLRVGTSVVSAEKQLEQITIELQALLRKL